mmetsp:Transcript_9123/g.18497  ORF Transcript_9123/g.18497 Transcript_9123/m.18497 type:complete len:460 (-) Transcript_9123:1402-2781(-)
MTVEEERRLISGHDEDFGDQEMGKERFKMEPFGSGQVSALKSVLAGFWPLGWISFGGPNAHVALAMTKFAGKKRDGHGSPVWISDELFLELFAVCQALPGPSSTQLITAIGAVRAGLLGGILALLLFQLPGFVAMTWLGTMFSGLEQVQPYSIQAGFLAFFQKAGLGLVAAAFAQVLYAAYAITAKTCGSSQRKLTIAVVTTFVTVVVPARYAPWLYPGVIVAGGLAEWLLAKSTSSEPEPGEYHELEQHPPISRRLGNICLYAFLVVSALALILVRFSTSLSLMFIFNTFWRVGSLVFGGGQVVLPFLYGEVVENQWMTTEVFMYGFALVQVIPGPMFNIAPFIGAAMYGPSGAVMASLGVFIPGTLLMFGAIPHWYELRASPSARSFLAGVNAAAAGLINAAVYIFLKTSLPNAAAFAIMIACGTMTMVWSLPVSLVIPLGGFFGWILQMLNIGIES